MPTFTSEAASHLRNGVHWPGLTMRVVEEKQEMLLAADIEELASLRASIVLTAKLESKPDEDPRFRRELRVDLENLRWRYFEKIDHIAMAFGVAQAMKARDEVERRVSWLLRTNQMPGPDGSDSTDL
jgi:predicted metal-dependent hydrolase